MDVAGIVIGVAGLYTICTEILDQIDSYRDFGVNSSALAARFEAEKLRLREWADIAGIHNGILAEEHHHRLDDLAVRSVVYQILYSIVDLFPHTEKTLIAIRGWPSDSSKSLKTKTPRRPRGPPAATIEAAKTPQTGSAGLKAENPGQNERLAAAIEVTSDLKTPQTGSAGFKASKRAKIKWIFGNETRFTRQVETFEFLTGKLYDLVPIEQLIDPDDAAGDVRPAIQGTTEKDMQLLSGVYGELRNLLEQNKKKAAEEDRKTILEFVKPPHISEDFENSLARCIPGTCEWIFSVPEYKEWATVPATSSTHLLWLNGTAGSGKSILCSRIISQLGTRTGPRVFRFFCTTHVQAGGKLDDIIRAWIFEMVEEEEACLELILDVMPLAKTRVPGLRVWDAFERLVGLIGDAIFVLDGLDEFNKTDDMRQTFVEKLKKSLAATGSRLLITSRDEVDIRRGVEQPEKGVRIAIRKISMRDTEDDVSLFSKELVKQKLGAKDERFRDELAATLAGRSEGMFLWVALSGKYLRGGLSKARILQTIKNVPDGLLSAYSRSWKAILEQPEYERTRALAILAWCVAGLRPLSISELTMALVIDVDAPGDCDLTDLPDDINEEYVDGEIVDLCGSLIETRATTEEKSLAKNTVHIVHFSVKDFLASAAADIQEFKVETENHRELARKCLRYLCYQNLKLEDDDLGGAFYDYALNHWHQHSRLSKAQDGTLNRLAIDFITNRKEEFVKWAAVFERNSPSKFDMPKDPSPIYFAAALNLTETLRYLLRKDNVNLDMAGGKLGAPIHASCFHGQKEALEILLESKADINSTIGCYTTALHTAVGQDYPELVKVLLEHKVLTDIKSHAGQTPIFIAAANGFDGIVSDLLESKADISITETGGWTPLNVAAANGHLSTVQILLDAGAKMTALEDGQTPLHSAALKGHVPVIRKLMDHGATPHTVTKTGWTPLHSACTEHRVEVVKFLLSLSTEDIDKSNQSQNTPANTVADSGDLDIIKILADNGADLSIPQEAGFTPLHNSAWKGHLSVVQFILERKPELMLKTNPVGCTPIYSAAQGGRPGTLAFLLRKWSGMIDIPCDSWTPLHAAAALGYQECVDLLLSHGAAINTVNKEQYTLLHSAAEAGHLSVVISLLEHAAKLDAAKGKDADGLVAATLTDKLKLVDNSKTRDHLDVTDEMGDSISHKVASPGRTPTEELVMAQKESLMAVTQDGSTVLHCAVKDGNIEVIKLLLVGAKECLSMTTSDRNTPLHIAASLGHSHLLELLLEYGAQINARNGIGMTPLNVAATQGRIETAKILLDKGASMEGNDEEQTPLNNSAFHGFTNIVRLFLNHGAFINVINKAQYTPMNAACIGNHIAAVELLLDRGADLQIPNKYGAYCLHTTAANSSSALAKLLLDKGAKINQVDNIDWTPLMYALKKDNIEVVRFLLEQGADTSLVQQTGLAALHLASQFGKTEVVRILLGYKPQLNAAAEGDLHSTPLYHAAAWDRADIVRMLLQAGANPNLPCDDGWTPLIVAADRGFVKVVHIILEFEPDLNKITRSGSYALLRATVRGHLEVVRMLVEAGAEFKTADKDGLTPILSAASQNNLPLLEFLLSHGADLNSIDEQGRSVLLAAVWAGNVDIVRYLLKRGVDTECVDYRKETTLISALTLQHLEIAHALVDAGANVNAMDDQGRNVLHSAARTGSLGVLESVYNRWPFEGTKDATSDQYSDSWPPEESSTKQCVPPAVLNQIRDNEGRTPLHYAANSGSAKCTEFLVSKGFDLGARDLRNRTVLDYACMSGTEDIVGWILKHHKTGAIDQRSWSPYHWACQVGNISMLRLLSEDGIPSTVVRSESLDSFWSPMDIARYNQNEKLVSPEGKLVDGTWDQLDKSLVIKETADGKFAPVYSNELPVLGTKFRGYCDGCYSSFFGPRFHCKSCADFDYCMMCKIDADISHPDHQWERIDPVAPTQT